MHERVVGAEVLDDERVRLRGVPGAEHQAVLGGDEPVELFEPLGDASPGDAHPGALARHPRASLLGLLLRGGHRAFVLRQRLAVLRVVLLLSIEVFPRVGVSAERQVELNRHAPVALQSPRPGLGVALAHVVRVAAVAIVAVVVALVVVHVEVVLQRHGDLVVREVEGFDETRHRITRSSLLLDHQRQVIPRHTSRQRAVHRRQHRVHLRQVVLDQGGGELLGLALLLQRPHPRLLVATHLFEFFRRGVGGLLAPGPVASSLERREEQVQRRVETAADLRRAKDFRVERSRRRHVVRGERGEVLEIRVEAGRRSRRAVLARLPFLNPPRHHAARLHASVRHALEPIVDRTERSTQRGDLRVVQRGLRGAAVDDARHPRRSIDNRRAKAESFAQRLANRPRRPSFLDARRLASAFNTFAFIRFGSERVCLVSALERGAQLCGVDANVRSESFPRVRVVA